MKYITKITLFVSVVLLSSCIIIDDFGVYWSKATADPKLAGKWGGIKESNAKTVFLVRENDYYVYFDDKTGKAKDDTKIKTLNVDDIKFLLIQNSQIKTMLIYKIDDNDKLSIYVPDLTAEGKFLERLKTVDKDEAITATPKGIFVGKLTNNILAKITKLAKNQEIWKKAFTMKRQYLESKPITQ